MNPARCPRSFDYRVLPVARIVEPPRGVSDWRPLVSIIFARSGRYHFYLLKVDYVEGGRRYWNYVDADIPSAGRLAQERSRLIQSPC